MGFWHKYTRYLKSGHWRQLRLAAFERDNYRCSLCKKKFLERQLNGHHLNYHKDLYKSTVEEIQTLCISCHEKLHAAKRAQRKANRRSRNAAPNLTDLILNFSASDQ